jgi:hypothetical protein
LEEEIDGEDGYGEGAVFESEFEGGDATPSEHEEETKTNTKEPVGSKELG